MSRKAQLSKFDTTTIQSTKETPLKFLEKNQSSESLIQTKNGTDLVDAFKEITGIIDTELAANTVLTAGSAMASCFPSSFSDKLNLMSQSLNDSHPKDAFEARLTAQATIVFSHAIKCLTLAESCTLLPGKESYTNMAVKLMRIHNETLETLTRYRRGGEQKISVTHAVLANQAIVNTFLPSDMGGVKKNQGDTPCH